jgi:hypothetical protein
MIQSALAAFFWNSVTAAMQASLVSKGFGMTTIPPCGLATTSHQTSVAAAAIISSEVSPAIRRECNYSSRWGINKALMGYRHPLFGRRIGFADDAFVFMPVRKVNLTAILPYMQRRE